MSEKFHLHTRIFRIHRFDTEVFCPHDRDRTVFRAVVLFLKKFLFKAAAAACEMSLAFGDKLVLILAKLSLDHFLDKIDRNIHIGAGLLGTDNMPFDRDCHFYFLALFFDAQGDDHFRVGCEVS